MKSIDSFRLNPTRFTFYIYDLLLLYNCCCCCINKYVNILLWCTYVHTSYVHCHTEISFLTDTLTPNARCFAYILIPYFRAYDKEILLLFLNAGTGLFRLGCGFSTMDWQAQFFIIIASFKTWLAGLLSVILRWGGVLNYRTPRLQLSCS